MTNYDAIKNLTIEQIEKFLDQVFLTGLNTGYQFVVDHNIYNGNPFDSNWLNIDVEESSSLVEDEAGESLIIKQLVNVVERIVEFDTDTIPDDISWKSQIVLPRGMEESEEHDNE